MSVIKEQIRKHRAEYYRLIELASQSSKGMRNVYMKKARRHYEKFTHLEKLINKDAV